MAVRVALIGCGGMGRALLKEGVTLADVDLVAVVDPDEGRRLEAARELGGQPLAEVGEALARDDLDAVFVATPGGFHREVVEAAAAAGKHVFCEKPLATSVADAEAMIAAVEAAGVKHMTGQVCRYHPTHRRLKQMVDDGSLGPVLAMYVERLGSAWGQAHPPWRKKYATSGGYLMEINAHELDLMLWLAGPVKSVHAVGGQLLDREIDYPDVAFVGLSFASGAVGVLHQSAIAEIGAYRGRFDCRNASAVVEKLFGGEITWKVRGEAETRTVTPAEMAVETPVLGEVRAFIEAVVNDTEPPITFHDGRRAVAVAEAAYRSIETGGPVDVVEGEAHGRR